MRIIKKIKKVIISATMEVMLLPKKIFAAINSEDLSQLQGSTLYGIPGPTPTLVSVIWKISEIFIIPLALIIRFIVYFKKSKSTTKRKIITMIIVLLIVIAICWGVNYLITNL